MGRRSVGWGLVIGSLSVWLPVSLRCCFPFGCRCYFVFHHLYRYFVSLPVVSSVPSSLPSSVWFVTLGGCSVDFNERGVRCGRFFVVGSRDVEVNLLGTALHRRRPGTVGVGLRSDGDVLVQTQPDGDLVRTKVMIPQDGDGGTVVNHVC